MTESETVSKVTELAGAGLSPRAIAKELDISRQRVYAICKRYSIPFAANVDRYHGHRAQPRIITGGVQQLTVSTVIGGKVSELLVAADLLARGWNVYVPIMSRHHDLIATRRDKLITIEVRSGRRTASGKIHFYTTRLDARSDHYALVLTGEPVCYQPDLSEIEEVRE